MTGDLLSAVVHFLHGEARNVSKSDISSGVIWFSKPSGISDFPVAVSESSSLRSSVVSWPCWPRSVMAPLVSSTRMPFLTTPSVVTATYSA